MEQAKLDPNLEIDDAFKPILTWPNYFYKQQWEFIESDAWQTWLICANGTGKSLLVYWAITAYMLGIHPKQFAPPPIKVRVLVPSFDSVEEIALDKLLEDQIIQPAGVEVGPLLPLIEIKRGFSKEHTAITLHNGSSVRWVTDVQGWKLQRGTEHDVLVMDEESTERVLDENIRGLRNAKGGGKLLGALTPPYEAGKGPTWTKEKIVDRAVSDENCHVINACMADNPAISPTFIEEFSRGKTQEQIDVQIFGKYPSWGKRIHYPFEDQLWNEKEKTGHLLPSDTPIPECHEPRSWIMAFDWHASKPCAAVFGWEDSSGNVIFFDELDKDIAEDKGVRELSWMFKEIEGPKSGRRFMRWQDPSAKNKYKLMGGEGYNAWQEFKKHGIRTAKGKNRDPVVGISIVNDYFLGNMADHPRVFIFEDMKFTRQYLNNHYWKRSEGNPQGKPDPKWSDYPVCMKYILQELGAKYTNRSNKRNKWPLQSFGAKKQEKTIIDISHLER